MQRVRVLHWNASSAATLIRLLDANGYCVEYQEKFSPQLLKQWRAAPPDVFVIDLSRLPSHGREIAVALRQSAKTSHIPLVFCNGAEDKVTAVREVLPDAVYCRETDLLQAIAAATPLADAIKPLDIMDRYQGRTTAQKLGIKEGCTLKILHPPTDVFVVLGPLPPQTECVEENAEVTLCFLDDADRVRSEVSKLRRAAAGSKLWLLWRKKTAAGHSGVTEHLVRDTALDLGLVDYKICSVNPTWSALLFALRKEPPRES